MKSPAGGQRGSWVRERDQALRMWPVKKGRPFHSRWARQYPRRKRGIDHDKRFLKRSLPLQSVQGASAP
jgi:hypothetical protein